MLRTDFFSALVVFVALSMSFYMCISIVHTIVIESVLSIVTVYLLKLPGELFLKTWKKILFGYTRKSRLYKLNATLLKAYLLPHNRRMASWETTELKKNLPLLILIQVQNISMYRSALTVRSGPSSCSGYPSRISNPHDCVDKKCLITRTHAGIWQQ